MRKTTIAVWLGLMLVLGLSIGAAAQPAGLDQAKFYVHFPLQAQGHPPNFVVVANFKPFDTFEACEKFRKEDWSRDAEFKKVITEWAEEETEVHQGKVRFGETYCARGDDDSIPKKQEQGV